MEGPPPGGLAPGEREGLVSLPGEAPLGLEDLGSFGENVGRGSRGIGLPGPCRWTGVPSTRLLQGGPHPLLDLEPRLLMLCERTNMYFHQGFSVTLNTLFNFNTFIHLIKHVDLTGSCPFPGPLLPTCGLERC